MLENILFYFVFLGQILLISYYYPKQILIRISYVLKTFPPEEYPKLYPKHPDYYKAGQLIYKIINFIILAIGLIVIVVIGVWDNSSVGKVSEAIPIAYFFLQMIPLLLMEISGFAYFKMMRKADMRTTRKANLQPRNLFDYVSSVAVSFAFILIVACIAFFYSLYGFSFDFENKTFVIVLSLVFSNLIFAGIIFWNLYGKKLDPHQAVEDRMRQVEVTIKSLVYMSIVASIFLIAIKAIDEFNLDYYEPVLMSFYLQFIMFIGLGSLLRNQRLEDMNFDVYKKDVQNN
ncbi:MAG: hypothetical protein D8M58_12490 [Calditrichaeota bacterium]|nr:MAG: hypothetical protein DWQ03_13275 [Calditrichota bacterium]MBL1206215.1 hypothetical protein [Calditrichota bacterium]NOG46041.1 hypothetical protein [Calditrichota bacterium]